MAITDLSAYGEMQSYPQTLVMGTKAVNANVANRFASLWTTGPDNGVTPTTATACNDTTVGALRGFKAGNGSPLRIVKAQFVGSVLGATFGSSLILADRLSHSGGLSGTTTGAQTTNLPTAALTRETSGDGVFMALEIYTAVGTTATTVSVSYTNQAGTAGHTSPLTDFGGTGFNAISRTIILPLQEGDTGVRSVESVTLTASTVSAAGNFGVTLFKPLMVFPCFTNAGGFYEFDTLLNLAACLPEIHDNSCLQWFHIPGTTTSGTMQANLWFSEDR